jgi:hypothetical protein
MLKLEYGPGTGGLSFALGQSLAWFEVYVKSPTCCEDSTRLCSYKPSYRGERWVISIFFEHHLALSLQLHSYLTGKLATQKDILCAMVYRIRLICNVYQTQIPEFH